MYYPKVPKELKANLAFRRRLHERAGEDETFRGDLLEMCRKDLLFYVNAFVYTYYPDPRESVRPFITYPYQDEAMLGIAEALGKEDVFIDKSRETGGTWCPLVVIHHSWLLRENGAFLLGSRKEDLVDDSTNPASLFWKLDFVNRHLPKWMLLADGYERTRMKLFNKTTHSVINGESTNPDFARGDRRTAILLDEFAFVECDREVEAATLRASRCRIYVSTPNGNTNVFAEKHQTFTGKHRYRFHWSEHPDFGAFKYTDEKGKLRSPWYDEQCKRTHRTIVARELDCDYQGSDSQFFEQELLDKVRADCCDPYQTVRFSYEPGSLRPEPFVESGFDVNLWMHLDPVKGCPSANTRYVIGADTATGTGSSNSVLSVGDVSLMEKVAEFVISTLSPERFAELAIALCKWFKGSDDQGAFLIWEDNGPGAAFRSRVVESGYRNFYYRRNEKTVGREISDYPGWWSGKESKYQLLSDLRDAYQVRTFTNRCVESLRECGFYVHSATGRDVWHSAALSALDPAASKDNHGDRVIADALLYHGMRDRGGGARRIATVRKECPAGSFAFRRKEWDDSRRMKEALTY